MTSQWSLDSFITVVTLLPKALTCHTRALPFWLHLTPVISWRLHLQMLGRWESGFSTFGQDTDMQSTAGLALVCVLPGVQPSSRAPTGGTVSPHRGVTCFCTWDPQPRFSHPQTCRLLRSPRRLSSSPALARTGPIFKAHLKPHLLQSTFSNLWFTLVISFHEPFQLDVHACQAASVLSDSLRAYPWDRIGSSIHGILQARILEWGALPSSRGSSRPRDWVRVSYISCVDRGGSSPLAPPLQL